MASPHSIDRQRSSNVLPWILLVLVLLGGGVYFGRERIARFLISATPTQSPASSISTLTGPGVLRRIQSLNNLETVAFRIETVVTSDKAGTWWKLWQDKQSAVFIADGTVIAGIDLSELQPQDVEVSSDGTRVRVTLPAAKILHTNLENMRTYDYKTGLFGLVNLDPKLLEQAQQDARARIQETACTSDILTTATSNGQRQIEGLFSMMNVQVTVMPAPIPSCTTTQ